MFATFTKNKPFIVALCAIILLFAWHFPNTREASSADLQEVSNVSASPLVTDGVSFNYFSDIIDVAFDDDYYYILADERLNVLDATSKFKISSQRLVNASALAVYENLIFVCANNEILILDMHAELSIAHRVTATQLSVLSLGDIVLVNNTVSAHIYAVADAQFACFEISKNNLGAQSISFSSNSVQYYISIKPALATDASPINAVSYGKVSGIMSSGLIFTTSQGVSFQNTASSLSQAVFYEEDIIDITFDSALERIVYTKKGCHLRSLDMQSYDSLEVAHTAHRIYYYKGNAIYTDNALSSVALVNTSTKKITEVSRSAAAQIGYYNNPMDISTANNVAYFADSGNGRIAALSNEGISYQNKYSASLENVSTVAVDSFGTVYASNNSNVLEFSSSGVKSYDFAATSIICGHDDSVYLIAKQDRYVYYKPYGAASFEPIIKSIAAPSRLAIDKLGSLLYILTLDGRIYMHFQSTTRLEFTPQGTPIDLATDDSGSLYVLYEDNTIIKYTPKDNSLISTMKITSYNSSHNLYPVALNAIEISTAQNDYIRRGTILLADSGASCIRAIQPEVLDVQILSAQSTIDLSDSSPLTSPCKIANTKRTINLFNMPSGSVITTIAANTSLIVLEQDVDISPHYSLVLYDNTSKSKAEMGYVLKQGMSDFIIHIAPPFARGRILNPNTYVYKYPSGYSSRISQNGELMVLDKDEAVVLMDFVAGFKDASGVGWLRISLGNNQFGFVNAGNVINHNYNPIAVRPVPNAKIKSNNISGALPYTKVDGKYVLLDELPIPNNSMVTVIGGLNPTSRYTLIQYYNEEFGMLECYVETTCIEYQGITPIEIAMFAVLVTSTVCILLMLKKSSKG